jgi:hypothetical protein
MLPDVRFGSKADMTALVDHVRYYPESGHSAGGLRCPLSANRRHFAPQQNGALFDHLFGAGE